MLELKKSHQIRYSIIQDHGVDLCPYKKDGTYAGSYACMECDYHASRDTVGDGTGRYHHVVFCLFPNRKRINKVIMLNR